jgi:hypothetical protein
MYQLWQYTWLLQRGCQRLRVFDILLCLRSFVVYK